MIGEVICQYVKYYFGTDGSPRGGLEPFRADASRIRSLCAALPLAAATRIEETNENAGEPTPKGRALLFRSNEAAT
jgi:hypothetical protein